MTALPVGHAHGSLSQHEALLMLYEETGVPKYLNRVVARWNNAVGGGYVSPAGGVLEKFVVADFNRDEGCAEADWLRVNLMLWHNTGEARYLDMAERTVWNEYFANQWPDGGYGHRILGVDARGPFAFREYGEEALWCCSFHGPLGLNEFKSYLAVGGRDGIHFNFPIDFQAPVQVSNGEWTVRCASLPPMEGIPVRCEVGLQRTSGQGRVPLFIRCPNWADTVSASLGATLLTSAHGTLNVPAVDSGAKLEIDYHAHPYLETRRFERVSLPKTLPARFNDAVIRFGPAILLNSGSGDIQPITLQVKDGFPLLPPDNSPGRLVSWPELTNSTQSHAYVFNVQAVPR